MDNNNSQLNLTSSQIIRATVIAFITSLIIAVVAVLPAQYGKDYSGLGKILGFSLLYQDHNKVDEKLAEKEGVNQKFKEITLNNVGSGDGAEKPLEANNPAPSKQYEIRSDSVKIIIPANKGLEYKIAMLKYGQVKYAWKTNEGVLFLDLHGDVKTATPNSAYFESYTVANSNNMAGSFVAPYEGKHGWYFKNKSNQDIEVSIRLRGEYQLIK